VAGQSVNPYFGFVGGTSGTGMTYFSGTAQNVTQETNYLTGEIYNTEYSKILPDAAFLTSGSGALYRTSNAKTTAPALVKVNSYSGVLSKIAPASGDFLNTGYTAGTPFSLWENYGQVAVPPDSAVYYNDTLRFQASFLNVATLTTQTTFTFSAARPNRFALIDSVVIRTATVTLPITPAPNIQPAFTNADRNDLTLKLNNNYVVTGSITTVPSSSITTTGMVSTSTGPSVTLNSTSLLDEITVTFSSPPFLTKTVTTISGVPNPADFYRIFATVFYKYKAGDSVDVSDNNISTKSLGYKTVLTKDMNWRYGSFPGYFVTAATNSAVSSPSYILIPGSSTPTTNPVFTVNPVGKQTYTAVELGTYTLTGIAVTHTLTALTTNTQATGNHTFVMTPGFVNVLAGDTITAPSTQANVKFVGTPPSTGTTIYNITEYAGSGGTIVAGPTSYTIDPPIYVLTPPNFVQGNDTSLVPVFVVTPTVETTFTIIGVSSNTTTGSNTIKTFNQTTSVVTVGYETVPFSKNNQVAKMVQPISSRLAIILNNSGNTGSQNAILVAKNALSLNDPLNLVRVSQSGCLTDDASGNPTFSTIAIPGKPLMLEWSDGGSELYYATSDNKLYRVSHIYSIMDQSAASYSGKFYTDIFEYNSSSVSNSSVNLRSPYRTTLIGDFGSNQITSISVGNGDKNLAVTLNTSTGVIVKYNKNDARKSNSTNIQWEDRNTGLPAGLISYCSMMEKTNNNKVFMGTNNGIFYTSDIASGASWVNVNDLPGITDKLPNVQVFDIEQQRMDPWDCYNSGQIYVATNGRGIWATSAYFLPYIVGIDEVEKPAKVNNLAIYPNPANGNVSVEFSTSNGEKTILNIMDLNGRVVHSENLGTLSAGDVHFNFDISSLSAGVYIVNINGDTGIKRVAKLIVTK
jgi:hypothetical protein